MQITGFYANNEGKILPFKDVELLDYDMASDYLVTWLDKTDSIINFDSHNECVCVSENNETLKRCLFDAYKFALDGIEEKKQDVLKTLSFYWVDRVKPFKTINDIHGISTDVGVSNTTVSKAYTLRKLETRKIFKKLLKLIENETKTN